MDAEHATPNRVRLKAFQPCSGMRHVASMLHLPSILIRCRTSCCKQAAPNTYQAFTRASWRWKGSSPMLISRFRDPARRCHHGLNRSASACFPTLPLIKLPPTEFPRSSHEAPPGIEEECPQAPIQFPRCGSFVGQEVDWPGTTYEDQRGDVWMLLKA